MFTGLVEEVGTVRRKEGREGFQRTIVAASPPFLDHLRVGDSVNVDGVCQTIVACGPQGFSFESIEETLRLTTLGNLKAGDRVNLERSLRAGDPLGGHLVAGHVDGVGRVADRSDRLTDSVYRIEIPKGLEKYIAKKGSIAVNGISLTVVDLNEGCFTVAIIPHTMKATNISLRHPGDTVNIEVDMVARYIERLLGSRASSGEGLTNRKMAEMGY